MRVIRSALFTLSLAAVTACKDNPSSPSSLIPNKPSSTIVRVDSLALDEIRQAQAGRRDRGEEDEMLRLEGKIPGFGGFFIDSGGTAGAYLKNATPSLSQALRDELVRTYSGRRSATLGDLASIFGNVRILDGQHSLSELIAFERILLHAPPSIKGVVGEGVWVRKNRLLVMFRSESERLATIGQLPSIGIPVEAIETTVGGEAVTTGTFQDTWRPVGSGVRFSWTFAPSSPYRCSVGPNATNSNGVMYWVTAAHCINGPLTGNGRLNDPFYQPYNLSNNIGSVASNPFWQTFNCPNNPTGQPSDFCPYVDALAGRYTLAVGMKKVATSMYEGIDGQPGTQDINGFYPVAGWASPELLDPAHYVWKSGQKTGTTGGNMGPTCWNAALRMEWGQNSGVYKWVWESCLVLVWNAGFGYGDSGGISFVRLAPGGPYFTIGMVVGGGEIYQGQDRCYQGPNCYIYVARWDRINFALSVDLGPLNPSYP